jgi:hypothetical protein
MVKSHPGSHTVPMVWISQGYFSGEAYYFRHLGFYDANNMIRVIDTKGRRYFSCVLILNPVIQSPRTIFEQ